MRLHCDVVSHCVVVSASRSSPGQSRFSVSTDNTAPVIKQLLIIIVMQQFPPHVAAHRLTLLIGSNNKGHNRSWYALHGHSICHRNWPKCPNGLLTLLIWPCVTSAPTITQQL